jgi:hypothetical protein
MLKGQVVAVVMDQRVATHVREKDFSLYQQERYASGEHFMRSILAQLRARGLSVLEVEDQAQAAAMGAPYVLLPDIPTVTVLRPKGLLDFSFLGSLNRIRVSYSVRLLRLGATIPERVSGSGSRTASFFWSNAILQGIGMSMLGNAVSLVIYSAWFAWVVGMAARDPKNLEGRPLQVASRLAPRPEIAIAVFVADHIVSQISAQVVPRIINPLVDILVNEPRWQVMVQGAHDEAAEDVADAVVRRLAALNQLPAPRPVAPPGGAP